MAATKEKPSVASQITDVEAPPSPGDSETLTVSDIVGPDNKLDLNIEDAARIVHEKTEEEEAEKAETRPDPEEEELERRAREKEEEETEEEDPEEAQKAAVALDLFDKYLNDPAAAMKEMWNAAGSEAQSQFIDSITGKKGQYGDVPDPHPESELEKFLHPVAQDLRDVPKFKSDTQKALGTHADFINKAHIGVACMEVMMEAIGSALGVKFPAIDYDGYARSMGPGKSYQDAIKPFRAAMAKQASIMKQAMKDRPGKSSSASAERLTVNPNADLKDWVKAYKEKGTL